jgi:hypothetical protein
MSEKKLFFVKYRAIGLVNSPMKDLANLFRKHENSLISSDNFDVFERVFNDFMKGYRGRAKLPVFKDYHGVSRMRSGIFYAKKCPSVRISRGMRRATVVAREQHWGSFMFKRGLQNNYHGGSK